MNKLSVGYVSPSWPLSSNPNGIVAYIENLLLGIGDNANPTILSNMVDEHCKQKNIIDLSKLDNDNKSFLSSMVDKISFNLNSPIISYKRNLTNNAKLIRTALNQLENPINILEIEESFGLAGFLAKQIKTPIVTRLHGPWFLVGKALKLDAEKDFNCRIFYEGKAITESLGLTSPSYDVLERVREFYNVELKHAQVIPNPVPDVDLTDLWQHNLNKAPSVLFVGRFDSVKGADLLLDAFRLAALRNQDLELIFVGPDRGVTKQNINFSFFEYVNAFIPESNIRNRIKFLGHCGIQKIKELRKCATVTVVCSRYETFSIALLEALSAGCPTVAMPVGGPKEIITNNYNGLFAEVESPESISEAILKLVDNPEMMYRLSSNAILDAKARFSPEHVSNQTLAYYNEVLGS